MQPLYVVMDTKDGALLPAYRSRVMPAYHSRVMPALYQHAGVAERARKERCSHKLERTVVCEAQITIIKVVEFND